MRGVVAVAGLLAVLVGTVAHGQPQGRRWQDLTPQERERAWQNYQRYQQWPQAKQRALDQRYQQYQSLPPQERERVWRNYQHYRELDPGQRQRFGEKYHRWKSGH
jgi:hypothetical protein